MTLIRELKCVICGMEFKTTHHKKLTCGKQECVDARRDQTRQKYLAATVVRRRKKKYKWERENPRQAQRWQKRYYYRHRDEIIAKMRAYRARLKAEKEQHAPDPVLNSPQSPKLE